MFEYNAEERKQSGVLLFNSKVEVWFPKEFYEDSEIIEKRYPLKNKSSVIKVDSKGKVFITFDLYSKQLNASQITDAAVAIRNIILQMYPYNIKKVLKYFQTIQGLQGVSFSFYTMKRYGRQFIEFFILSIHNQLFLGTVTCPEENRYEWNSIFSKVKMMVREIE